MQRIPAIKVSFFIFDKLVGWFSSFVFPPRQSLCKRSSAFGLMKTSVFYLSFSGRGKPEYSSNLLIRLIENVGFLNDWVPD